MLPIFDLSTQQGQADYEARLALLQQSSSLDSQWHSVAAEAIDLVRKHGDDAVVAYMRRFTDPQFHPSRICVTKDELAIARAQLDPTLGAAIQRAIENVRTYQQHLMPREVEPLQLAGAELGLRWTPIQPIGLCVPGGAAVLFSTLIMLAVPAMVAGVRPGNISVISPPPNRQEGQPGGDISPITLAVCDMLGIERVYRIGGPAAVAALALGTEQVDAVQFIAGPGHPVVQAAKSQVQGMVGIDGFYGASEVVTLADDSADPGRIAADLLAQAEHDPGKCFLICWQREVIDTIVREVGWQLPQLKRQAAIRQSLGSASCAILVEDPGHAAVIANQLAGEHVNLAVRDVDGLLTRIRHGGEFFLGDATPVASGDYYAGPSHCLPTGTTARFSSGVSVYTFLKRSGIVRYPDRMPEQAVADIALLAETEGLDAHAQSVRRRG